jgi:hypothetical protein
MKVTTEGVKFVDRISTINEFPMDQVPAEERESMKSSYIETDATSGVMEEQK